MRKRAEDIFQAVVDAPPPERCRLLDQRCEGDAVLRASVEKLLDTSDDIMGDFLASAALESPASNVTLPERVGRYKLVRVIGEGGMGVVYEAVQDNPSRSVALKVIRSAFAPTAVYRRFEHEVRALGQLQHPGIAHIYEAGVVDVPCPGGTSVRYPFLAMELIRGEHLMSYARGRALDTCQRLELMTRVCDAVQHAHNNGIIHRDLKPANIMVVEDTPGAADIGKPQRGRGSGHSVSGVGQPKVLDFGLARATPDNCAHRAWGSGQTSMHQIVGTLPYMSPEQVAGDPMAPIDTRADVYSLGVVLFELLTDRLPHDVSAHALPEAVRRIRETEPKRLSSMDRSFRGDLDTICATALAKDVHDRYPSAHALAEDIRRYQSGEAIDARRESTIYVVGKQLRRHRWAVATALAAIFALAAFSIYASLEASRYSRLARDERAARQRAQDAEEEAQAARSEALTQKRLAENQAQHAQAVTAFLTKTLGLADPDITQTPELTMKEALDRASAQVAAAFADQPAAEAQVRLVIGRAYASLGELTQAELHLARALEIRERVLASGPQELYEIRWPYANVVEDLSRYDWSHHWWERWYLYPKMFADQHPRLAAAIVDLGHNMGSRFDRQKTGLAYGEFRRAAESLPKGDPQWLVLADFLHIGGVNTGWKGNPGPACDYLEDALAIERRFLPETNTRIARTLGELVRYMIADGRYEDAEALTRESLELLGQVLPPDHWYAVVQRARLGASLTGQGRFEEAEALLTEALAAIDAARGETNRFAREAVEYLIELHETWQKPDAARKYRRSLAERWAGADQTLVLVQQFRPIIGPEHAEFQSALERFDEQSRQQWSAGGGVPAEALGELLDLRRRHVPDDHPVALALADLLRSSAAFYDSRRGMNEQTFAMIREVEHIYRASNLVHPWKKASCLISLASHLESRGEHAEGESIARQALSIYDAHGSRPGDSDPSKAHSILGACLLGQGRFAEAEPLLIRGYQELLTSPYAGPGHRTTQDALSRIVSLYEAWGQTDRVAEFRADLASSTPPDGDSP